MWIWIGQDVFLEYQLRTSRRISWFVVKNAARAFEPASSGSRMSTVWTTWGSGTKRWYIWNRVSKVKIWRKCQLQFVFSSVLCVLPPWLECMGQRSSRMSWWRQFVANRASTFVSLYAIGASSEVNICISWRIKVKWFAKYLISRKIRLRKSDCVSFPLSKFNFYFDWPWIESFLALSYSRWRRGFQLKRWVRKCDLGKSEYT